MRYSKFSEIDWTNWQPKERATLLFVLRDGQILLIHKKRGLGAGKINAPGGRLENGETPLAAAIRETQEETLLNIRLDGLLNVYSYANVGIVLVVYRATVVGGVAGITPESQEVRAFCIEDIPWAALAFPSTREALTDYVSSDKKSKKLFVFASHYHTIYDTVMPGLAPSSTSRR